MNNLKFVVILYLVSLLIPLSVSAQEIHPQPSCTTGSLQTLDWSSVSWTPNGATSFTATNVNGSGVDITFSYTGDVGNFSTLSGFQTPTTSGTILSTDPTLDMFVNPGISGDTDGIDDITLNISFSPAVEGNVAFDFYHVNGSSFSGDQLTTSSDLGNPPSFTGNGTPSWTETSLGFIQATSGSTTGTNDQAGVNFTDTAQAMNDISVVWEDCENICGTGQHGYGLGNIDFCLLPPPVAEDDSADAGGNTSVTLDALNNDSVDANAPVGTTLDPVTFNFDPASVGGTCVTVDADGDCTEVNVPGEGIWTVDTSGMVTFSAFSSFAGNPSPIDYSIEDTNGYASNIATISITNITPVTLSSFSSVRSGDTVDMDWGTSSELFNVGFQLWGLDGHDSKWEKLHGWLIRSGSGNAVESQSYSKTATLPKSITELVALGLSSVDSDGSEHYYGPFNVGQSYGNLSTLKPIAWNHIRSQVDAQMAAHGYVKDSGNGYRKVSAQTTATTTTESVIELSVRTSGMYRVTAQALLAAGIDWQDVSKHDIALIDHNDNAVVRYVSAQGLGSSKALGNKGEIYFYASSIDEKAGLYTDTRVYRLVIDRYRALAGQYQRKQGITSGISDYYMETSRVENDGQYELSSAADDPWIDAVVVSYPDKTASFGAAIPVAADALWSQPSTLRLGLARNSGLQAVDGDGNGQIDAEHIVEGQVLSSQGTGGLLALGTEKAVGKGDWSVEFKVPGNTPLTLIGGNAVVGGIFSAGAGYKLSEVHVDGASLSYARPYVAKADEDYLTFTGPDSGELGYEVTVPDTGWPVVFAYNESGALVRVALESQTRLTGIDGTHQRQVKLARLNGAGTQSSSTQYWVSGKRGYLRVDSIAVKSVVSTSSLLAQAAGSNYLMIAHPVFMGTALDAYADFKRSQGYRVSIVDYLQIVDVFGGGQTGPHGLTAYLTQAEAQGDLDHVLLVGGSSYDHTDKLGTGAMTFIPGHYAPSNYSKFTVSDVPYITGNDNVLFADIGRWPVRSDSDLSAIVDKSIAFANTDHSAGHVLSIAEHTVANENIDFSAALNAMNSLIPASWSTSEVHVDKVAKANNLSLPNNLQQALTLAKTALITELNKAPDMVLYNGHGTTSQLSNKGLFKSSDIASVTAKSSEVWLPMSCYVTYFESTHMNTLAHQLLFHGNAVNISGAMLLSNQGENIAAGSAILDKVLNENKNIGKAVTEYKSQSDNASLNINWALLGDPTLEF